MSAPLLLILIVAVGYLAAHVLFEWLARRHGLVSGAEYLLLGVLLGPEVAGVIDRDAVQRLTPVTMLALGWIGTGLGLRLHLPSLVRARAFMLRIGLAEALATLVLTAGVMALALSWYDDLALSAVISAAVCLGAVACCSGMSAIDVAAVRLGTREPIVRQLQLVGLADALVAVLAVALVLALEHPGGTTGWPRDPTATEWMVITIALGIGGGTLVQLFVGETAGPDRLLVALAASILLVSGAALYLQLSPLLPSLLLGALLANTSRRRRELAELLARIERPFTFVLLICAGAVWEPTLRQWGLPVILFLVLRMAGKLGGARLAARLNGMLPAYGATWGTALLGQGSLAIAIGLNVLLVTGGPLGNLVFSAALASILLTDLLGARFAEGVARRLLGPLPEPIAAAEPGGH